MIEIDFLAYQADLQLKREGGQLWIYDPIRKKYLVKTPEEVVRQLVLCYLMKEKNFPKNRIRVEKMLVVNELTKRCDILVYDWDMGNYLLVECKAPQVKLSQDTFRQIAAYNLPLRVQYLVVCNGLQTFCCKMDYEGEGAFKFLHEVPVFPAQSYQ